MKKIFLSVIVCSVFVLGACGKKDSSVEEVIAVGQETETADQENTEKSETISEGTVSNDMGETNLSWAYKSDFVVDVPIGFSNEADFGKVGTVKMGTDYYIAGDALSGNGDAIDISEGFAPKVSEMDLDDGFVMTAVATSQGDEDSIYTYAIAPKTQFNITDYKKAIPDGVEIGLDTKHPAYMTVNGERAVRLAYKIDDEWTFVIAYEGELVENHSLEELAQEFYNLVTPIN